MDLAISSFGVAIAIYGVLGLFATWVFPSWSRSPLFGRWFEWQPEPSRASQTAMAATAIVMGIYLFGAGIESRILMRTSTAALVIVVPIMLVIQYRRRR